MQKLCNVDDQRCYFGGGGGGGGDGVMTVLVLAHIGLLVFFPVPQQHDGVLVEVLEDGGNKSYEGKMTRMSFSF
jgi:hypothetical protein